MVCANLKIQHNILFSMICTCLYADRFSLVAVRLYVCLDIFLALCVLLVHALCIDWCVLILMCIYCKYKVYDILQGFDNTGSFEASQVCKTPILLKGTVAA